MKQFFSLLTIIFFSFAARGYNVLSLSSSTIEEDNKLPGYEVSCNTTDSGFLVTYSFSGVGIIEDDSIAGTYHCQIDGFSSNILPGLPDVPQRTDRILMPYKTTYELEIVNVETIDINIRIAEVRDALIAGDRFLGAADTEISVVDSLSFVELNSVQCSFGSYFQYYRVMPVAYNPGKGKATIAKTISFKLVENVQDGIASYSDNYVSKDFWGANLWDAVNNSGVIMGSSSKLHQFKEDYLVITTDSLLSSVRNLIDWKQKQGYNVELKSKEEWTEAEVFDAVKAWCDSVDYAKYFLLIGDIDKIPNKKSPYNANQKSDLYYACLDGEDDYSQDLLYGRIPASSLKQANNAIEKIISYEQNPITLASGSNFAALSYFQTYNYNRTKESSHSFLFNTENIFNSVKVVFDNSKRLYYCEKETTPLVWNNQKADGDSIPNYLRKPNFNWDTTPYDVADAIDNSNLVFYYSHGSPIGWGYPPFYINDLKLLKNKSNPIILAMTCDSGKYWEQDCFANSILFLRDYGCSSILACTGTLWLRPCEPINIGLFNAIWPSMNLKCSNDYFQNTDWQTSKSYSSTLGEALFKGFNLSINLYGLPYGISSGVHTGISNLLLENIEGLEILGDPSIRFFWDSETNVKNLTSLSYEDTQIKVAVKNLAIISFYDKVTGENDRYFSNSAKFHTDNPDNTYITVTVAGAAPLHGWYRDLRNHNSGELFQELQVNSCEFDGKQINVSFEGDIETACDLKIHVVKIANGLAIPLLNDFIYSNPSSFPIAELNKNDIIVVNISHNTEVIYSTKIIVQ